MHACMHVKENDEKPILLNSIFSLPSQPDCPAAKEKHPEDLFWLGGIYWSCMLNFILCNNWKLELLADS